ncbi:MAG: YdcF family protein [Candidatus Gracilibacteria bacterium]|nr:YdcF family protein [Candidatus Gracilibacteria bacterium]
MKWLKRTLCGILILAVGSVGISAWWVWENYDHTATGKADCAVVFGAAVWPGDRPSHALRDRTMAGVERWRAGQVDCLIFSGAEKEPAVMEAVALRQGVEEEDIFLDESGDSTLATVENLDPGKSYILVSNDFHLGRIRMLAGWSELDFELQAAPYITGRYDRETYFFWREVAGVLWYFFQGKF